MRKLGRKLEISNSISLKKLYNQLIETRCKGETVSNTNNYPELFEKLLKKNNYHFHFNSNFSLSFLYLFNFGDFWSKNNPLCFN